MEQGYEIYYVFAALALSAGLLKGLPALLAFEKQRLLDDEKRQYRSNEERRREELHQAKLNAIKTGNSSDSSRGKRRRSSSNHSQSNRDANRGAKSRSSFKSSKFNGLKGKLIDFGADHYKHDENQDESFFVKLLVDGNEKTLWGKGLRDVVCEFQRGQDISLERGNKEKVTVEKTHHDEAGNIIKTEMVPTYRQQWIGKLL
ncbi:MULTISPECIES: hypothetical protein [Vibrio harveyi group]|uniref:hypothetical protein n=1 Tax=Vibrio harveyi group TaxID=717610 RepID=UPI000971B303|nr:MULTISPECIES: hypothetical protein [Vibrio harveyi group]APX10259.1 hypothetical protein BWP24_29125 [Vibrio campbellii]MBE4253802.1 hypothetical protein [Vibrio parahaemolyticus]MDA0403982.1 hypothetical protein [Vibrio parahaemolyticus]MDG2632189.1 hypothetical protein [Vibrio parahaemolyticus]HCG7136312.1 hypothetical protein [Vibrio parahaemolyticus]